MATSKKTTKKEAAAPQEAPAQINSQVQAPAEGRKVETAEDREKFINEKFVPEAVEFMKKQLGIDLNDRKSCSKSFLYDLLGGNVTEVREIAVTPIAYDREAKENVAMPKILSYNALQVRFPQDENFNMIAPTKENPIKVFAFPCYEYVQKAYGSALETASDEPEMGQKEYDSDKELPTFSDAQMKALEGIGISSDRLFITADKQVNRTNETFSVAMKSRILDGKEFNYHGAVRTEFGSIRVAGKGKLVGEKAFFTPNHEVRKHNNEVLDLSTVKRIGNIELDIFERDANGRPVKAGDGRYQLTQEARDLALYGRTFAPMTAFKHNKTWNEEEKKWDYSIEKTKVFAAQVAGGVFVTTAKKVNELDQDGNKIMVTRNGKEYEKFHYEAYSKINGDGTVNVKGQNIAFRSPEDAEGFKRGRGGMGVDFITKVDGVETKEQVWLYPDITKSGFANNFGAEASAKLDQRFTEAKAMREAPVARRKANFSL